MPLPLEGIRILDFTHMLSGPMATSQLCHLGAEVIKVEPPGQGDAMRWKAGGQPGEMAPSFVAVNAGKRSLALDLKREEGRALVRALVPGFDVVVSNFRPGVMAALGLGEAELERLRPGLIVCAVTGYGAHTAMRDWPAYDHVVQAFSGMAWLNGDADDGPIKVGFPVLDVATGMQACSAILAALLRRERGGGGQRIEVSMLDAAATLMRTAVAGHLDSATVAPRSGNRGFTGSPGCDTFATAEGWIALGANTPTQFVRLLQLLGIAELADDAALIDPASLMPGGRGFVRARDGVALRERLQRALQTRTAAHWEGLCNAEGVPAARLRRLGEFVDGPLQELQGSVLQLPPLPVSGRAARIPNVGYRAEPDPPGVARPCVALGQDTRSVLQSAAISHAQIDALFAAGVLAEPAAADAPA